MHSCEPERRVGLLSLLALLHLSMYCTGCLAVTGRFLEGTEVLEKKESRIEVTGVLQAGYHGSGLSMFASILSPGFRYRHGVGAHQELRFETGTVLPGFNFFTKLAWKLQMSEAAALIIGAGGTTGLNDDLAPVYLGGDLGLVFSTGVARPIDGQRLRPYWGVRLGAAAPLGGSASNARELATLSPTGATGIRYVVSETTAISLEIGYAGLYKLMPEPVALDKVRPVDNSHSAPVHIVFAGFGISWLIDNQKTRERKLQEEVEARLHKAIEAGDEAMEYGNYPGAIAAFEKAFQLQRIPWLLCNIGEAYRRNLDWAQARRFFERCIQLNANTDYVVAARRILQEIPTGP